MSPTHCQLCPKHSRVSPGPCSYTSTTSGPQRLETRQERQEISVGRCTGVRYNPARVCLYYIWKVFIFPTLPFLVLFRLLYASGYLSFSFFSPLLSSLSDSREILEGNRSVIIIIWPGRHVVMRYTKSLTGRLTARKINYSRILGLLLHAG